MRNNYKLSVTPPQAFYRSISHRKLMLTRPLNYQSQLIPKFRRLTNLRSGMMPLSNLFPLNRLLRTLTKKRNKSTILLKRSPLIFPVIKKRALDVHTILNLAKTLIKESINFEINIKFLKYRKKLKPN